MHNKTQVELECEKAEMRLRLRMQGLRWILEKEILKKRYELLGAYLERSDHWLTEPRESGGEWTDSGNAKPKPVTEPAVKPEAKPAAKPGVKPAKEFSTSKRGKKFIKKREGFREREYTDSAGHRTIGFGHKLKNDEKYPDGISEAKALELFANDVIIAATDIKDNVKAELTQNQFDALTSFVFNIGGENFRNSTLLRLLNQGKYNEAADELPKWKKVTLKDGTKVPNAGLTSRRKLERSLFLGGAYK